MNIFLLRGVQIHAAQISAKQQEKLGENLHAGKFA